MKKTLSLCLLSLSLAVLFFSCKNEDFPEEEIVIPSELKELLDQQWDFAFKYGGFGGLPSSAEDLEYTETIVFNKNGSVTEYRDNEKRAESRFRISISESMHNALQSPYILHLGNGVDKWITIRNDSLLLEDRCYDCFSYTYKVRK